MNKTKFSIVYFLTISMAFLSIYLYGESSWLNSHGDSRIVIATISVFISTFAFSLFFSLIKIGSVRKGLTLEALFHFTYAVVLAVIFLNYPNFQYMKTYGESLLYANLISDCKGNSKKYPYLSLCHSYINYPSASLIVSATSPKISSENYDWASKLTLSLGGKAEYKKIESLLNSCQTKAINLYGEIFWLQINCE